MDIYKRGVIVSGDYVGWSLTVVDDRAVSGGFYLYLNNGVGDGFDYWFEKEGFLKNQLDDFDVNWV